MPRSIGGSLEFYYCSFILVYDKNFTLGLLTSLEFP